MIIFELKEMENKLDMFSRSSKLDLTIKNHLLKARKSILKAINLLQGLDKELS